LPVLAAMMLLALATRPVVYRRWAVLASGGLRSDGTSDLPPNYRRPDLSWSSAINWRP
jgi:hypothetical protein